MIVRLAFTPEELLGYVSHNDLERLVEREAEACEGREVPIRDFAVGDTGVDHLDGDAIVWFDVHVSEKSMLDIAEEHQAERVDLARQREKEER